MWAPVWKLLAPANRKEMWFSAGDPWASLLQNALQEPPGLEPSRSSWERQLFVNPTRSQATPGQVFSSFWLIHPRGPGIGSCTLWTRHAHAVNSAQLRCCRKPGLLERISCLTKMNLKLSLQRRIQFQIWTGALIQPAEDPSCSSLDPALPWDGLSRFR